MQVSQCLLAMPHFAGELQHEFPQYITRYTSLTQVGACSANIVVRAESGFRGLGAYTEVRIVHSLGDVRFRESVLPAWRCLLISIWERKLVEIPPGQHLLALCINHTLP